MRVRSRIAWSGVALAGLAGAGFAGWLLSLPRPAEVGPPPAIPRAETDAALAGLRPPRRARPVIAVVGASEGTETTDYLMPYGILKRAGVAEVVALGTRAGPVRLYPALAVEPDATLAEFDARHPEGADYVIVPALAREDDPAVLGWIARQAGKGATVVGVCVGAKVVAGAGLLDGKRATTHWYRRTALLEEHPAIRWVPDRRLVVDQGVATTTGISASMPMALTLVEAIAGRARAEAVARDLGVAAWDARHASGAFAFTRPFATTVLANVLAFWRREELGIEVAPGVDEVSLALVADAWSRTYRSRAVTYAPSAGPLPTRSGLRLLPDQVGARPPPGRTLPAIGARAPAQALEDALRGIEARYGARTADAVAMQLEYPQRRAGE